MSKRRRGGRQAPQRRQRTAAAAAARTPTRLRRRCRRCQRRGLVVVAPRPCSARLLPLRRQRGRGGGAVGELHSPAWLALDHTASARERPGRGDLQGGGRGGARSRRDARRRRQTGRAPASRCAGAQRGLCAPELAQGLPRRPLTREARRNRGQIHRGTAGLPLGTAHGSERESARVSRSPPYLVCVPRNAVPSLRRTKHYSRHIDRRRRGM